MHYKAILFDLDGTLLDSVEDIADSVNEVLRKFGFPIHSLEAYKYFVGDGMSVLAERVLPKEKSSDKVLVCQFVNEVKKEYNVRWNRNTKPYADIPELLVQLAERNILTAVLSNKPDDFTRMMIRYFFPDHHFRIVLGSREGFPRKPDPRAALEIAHDLGISSSECIQLGDTGTDMMSAQNSGMYGVGVSWGFRSREELQKHGAHHILEKPLELLLLL
jgi:phosphoglycolate phosphatase